MKRKIAVNGFLVSFLCAGAVFRATAADVVLDADLVIDGSVYTNLTDNYSGTGGIRITGGATNATRRVSFSGYLVAKPTDAGVMVITNAYYLDVTPVSATAKGDAMIQGAYTWIGNRVDHAAGEYSTFEFQYNENKGSAIKTAFMQLKQDGFNVLVSYGTPSAEYLRCKDVTDPETGTVTPAATVAQGLVGKINYHEGDKTTLTPSPYTDYTDTAYAMAASPTPTSAGPYGIYNPVFEVGELRQFGGVPGYLPISSSAPLILTNAYYLRVEPLRALVRGVSMYHTYWGRSYSFFHRRDYAGSSAHPNPYSEVQAQMLENTTVKNVYINIEQRGNDVAVYASDARYATASDTVYVGADFREISSSSQAVCWDGNLNGYGVSNALFACRGSVVRLGGNNSFEGDVVADAAYLVADGDRNALSTGRTVAVTNGTTLVLAATNGGQLYNVEANIFVARDSNLRLLGSWLAHTNPKVHVEGGSYEIENGNSILTHVWLKDGGEITDGGAYPPYCGSWNATGESYNFFKSEGSGTNVISASPRFYAYHDCPFVSFDCDADLLVTGKLADGSGGGTGPLPSLYKRGAADLILRGSASNKAEWRLLEGTVRLEADSQLWASNALYLAGGDLVCAANTSNDVSSLSVNDAAKTLGKWTVPANAGGTVTFEPNAKLTVAAKGSVWPALNVNRVTLVGELTNGNFRIGVSRCLSDVELRAFRYRTDAGKLVKVRQDGDGYILPRPNDGLILFFR